MYKFVLSACLVFDKTGKTRGQVGLLCAAFNAFLGYQRYTTALIFKRSVFYATMFYEIFTVWLNITVSIVILSDVNFDISSFVLLLTSGIFLGITIVFKRDLVRKKCLET